MKKSRIKKILLTTLAMLPCFNTYSFAAQNSRTVSQRTNSNSKNRRRQNNPETENEKTLSGYAPSDLLSYHKKHGIVSLTKALTKSPKGIPYLGGAGVLGAAGIGVLGFAGYKGGKFIQGKLKKPNPNLGNGNQNVDQNLNTGNPPENGEEPKGDIIVPNTQPNVNEAAPKPEVKNVVQPTTTNPNTNANNNEQENQQDMQHKNIEVKKSWEELFDALLKEKSSGKVLAPYSNMTNRNKDIKHYNTCGLNANKESHNTVNGDSQKCSTQFTSDTMHSFRIRVGGSFFGDYDPLFTACRWHEKGKATNSEVESPVYWFGKFVVFGNTEDDQATLNDKEKSAEPLMLSDLKYSLRLLWGKWQKALPASQNSNMSDLFDPKNQLITKLNDALRSLDNMNTTVESLYKTATAIDKLRLQYNLSLAQEAKDRNEKNYSPLTILNHSENLNPKTGFSCLKNFINGENGPTYIDIITGKQNG